jgi:hypothetical protein
MNYFIRDCNDNIRGNPNGYTTMQRANKALAQKHKFTNGLTLKHWLWDYHEKQPSENETSLIYTIK